ncbi:hypothetical protein Tco_0012845 [Tanacetum coccineum]
MVLRSGIHIHEGSWIDLRSTFAAAWNRSAWFNSFCDSYSQHGSYTFLPSQPQTYHTAIMVKMVPYEAFACPCGAEDVVLRESYKPKTHESISMKDLGLISDQPLLLHGTGVLGLTLFVIATPSTTREEQQTESSF